MAFVPATFEILGISLYGVHVLGFTSVEGLVLGTILVAIGDGLVIPKMKEFSCRFVGHPLPRLVFIWAPLEASFALSLFGTLKGFAAPAHQHAVRTEVLILANILRIAATVLLGALLGGLSGLLVSRRTKLTVRGNQVFTGSATEAFLMILAIALLAFGLSAGGPNGRMVPLGFCDGSLFQPELVVIMTGIFFAAVADDEVVLGVENVMGGVWIFGQIVLFSMLGSRTTLSIFPEFIHHVLPMLLTGLCFRFMGVFLSINSILSLGFRGHPFKRSTVLPDSLFCFLSTVPRATIQGALGQVPVSQKFFQHNTLKSQAQEYIFMAAR